MTGVVAGVGALLAATCLLLRLPRGSARGMAVALGATILAAGALLTGRVEIAAAAWLGAAVAVSGRDRPTDLRTAIGVLGDATAVAGLAALAIDTGNGELPWSGGPGPEPWTLALVAIGVGIRAVAVGMREPGLFILGCAVAANLARSAGAIEAPAWLAILAIPAAAVAWSEGALVGLPILAGALWGVDHPVASEAAAYLWIGAAVAASGVALAGAPAVGGHWPRALNDGPGGGATAGGLALIAAIPAAVGLLRVPVGEVPETVLVLISTLAVLAAGAAALGARRLRAEVVSPRTLGSLVAATALTLIFVFPAGYADVLDVPGRAGAVLPPILSPTRDALLEAGAFALIGTGLLSPLARPGRGGRGESAE